jgi:hypothetical protein
MSGSVAAETDRRRLLLAGLAAVVVLVGLAVPAVVAVVARRSSASFADTEVLATNHLGAAILDIEVGPNPDRTTVDAGSEAPRMVATNLAPGDVVSGHLELRNVGDVPLRFGLSAVADDDGFLASWLRFETWQGNGTCAPGQPGVRLAEDVVLSTTPTVLIDLAPPPVGQGIELAPGASTVVCIGAELPLETPNEAQGRALGVTFVIDAEQVVEANP